MTEIFTTTLIPVRRPSPLLRQRPRLAIGRAISEISSVIGEAFEMAYVTPFNTPQIKPPLASNADLDGRDPTW